MGPSKAVGIHASWAGAGGGATWGSKPEHGKGGTHEGGRWPFGVSESKWGEEGIWVEDSQNRVSQPSGMRRCL